MGEKGKKMTKKIKDIKQKVFLTLLEPESYVSVLREPYSTKGMETFVLFNSKSNRVLDLSVTAKKNIIVYEMVLPVDERISRIAFKNIKHHTSNVKHLMEMYDALKTRSQDKR